MVLGKMFADKPLLQLLSIISLCLISVAIFSIIGTVLTMLLYDISMFSTTDYYNPRENMVKALKLIQLLSALGLFIVPPLVYAFIFSKNAWKSLGLTHFSKPANYGLLLLLMIVFTPFLSWMVEWNAQLTLPDALEGIELWMKNAEKQAMELTKIFLSFETIPDLLYTLLVVAIVPAIGEELLFRGILQKIAIQCTKSAHLGILITAILFSALHLQFYGFLPRMLLGLVFGYLFYWSKSLWLPIVGHFINNGSVVITSYFYPETIHETEFTFLADSSYKELFSILSLILTGFILFTIKNAYSNQKMS